MIVTCISHDMYWKKEISSLKSFKTWKNAMRCDELKVYYANTGVKVCT